MRDRAELPAANVDADGAGILPSGSIRSSAMTRRPYLAAMARRFFS